MKRKGTDFPLEYYPEEILINSEARKNCKLVIGYVKKSNRRSDYSLCCCENFH